MSDDELIFAGIAEQARRVRAGDVGARELVEATLRRIEALDPTLNAFRVVLGERALAEAEQAEARRREGDDRPLLGVPIAVKDDIDVAGVPTAAGTRSHPEPADRDVELITRLRTAGAVMIGKTHVPELTQWPFTESMTHGITRNPWDPERTPGGSSGGSAAAVAAGMVGAAIGSDGGGSIRIPASCCGLFGLKPQRDRVPVAPRTEPWQGLSVWGPLTRSVRDAALFMDAVAPAPEGTESFAAAAAAPPGRLTVAMSLKLPPGVLGRLDPSWARATEATATLLGEMGHDVVDRDPPYDVQMIPAFVVRYLRGIVDEAARMPHPERLERRTRQMLAAGRLIPAGLLTRMRAAEAGIRERLGELFADCDVLMTPGLAQPPPRVGRWEGRGALVTFDGVARYTPYTAIWNVTGQPGASVPCGLDERGLPLAVQLIGRPGAESTLLSLAAQLEAARPWADRRPPIA